MEYLNKSSRIFKKEKCIYLVAKSGLCNRLRAMASAWILGIVTKRSLKIVWGPQPGFVCRWNKLFEETKTDKFEIVNSYPKNNTQLFKGGIQGEQRLIQQMMSCDSDNLVIEAGGVFRPPEEIMSLGVYNSLKSEFYQDLPIERRILRKVNEFTAKHFTNKVAGIHIRLGDRSRLMKLQAIKHNILDIITPFKKVVVCSDNKDVAAKLLKELFPNKTFVYIEPRRTRPGYEEEIIDGFIDWIVLSRCNAIGLSYASSFSQEAAIVNKRDMNEAKLINPQKHATKIIADSLSRNNLPLVYAN